MLRKMVFATLATVLVSMSTLTDPRPHADEEYAEGFACFGTQDFAIGYRAFLTKQEPEFKGS